MAAGADQGGLRSEHDNPCNVVPVSRLTQGAPLAPSADLPGPPLVALLLIAAALLVCGVVRATIYLMTGY